MKPTRVMSSSRPKNSAQWTLAPDPTLMISTWIPACHIPSLDNALPVHVLGLEGGLQDFNWATTRRLPVPVAVYSA
jgi:hypothetical protein